MVSVVPAPIRGTEMAPEVRRQGVVPVAGEVVRPRCTRPWLAGLCTPSAWILAVHGSRDAGHSAVEPEPDLPADRGCISRSAGLGPDLSLGEQERVYRGLVRVDVREDAGRASRDVALVLGSALKKTLPEGDRLAVDESRPAAGIELRDSPDWSIVEVHDPVTGGPRPARGGCSRLAAGQPPIRFLRFLFFLALP